MKSYLCTAGWPIFGFAVGLSAVAAGATTITVIGAHTGTPGTPTVAPPDATGYQYVSQKGTAGYTALADENTYLFNNVVASGGAGGSIIGTNAPTSLVSNFIAAGGSSGVNVESELGDEKYVATFNGGTYTGGAGGSASGDGNELEAGYGGSGVGVSQSYATINSGIFIGGSSGTITGDFNQGSIGEAGAGLFDLDAVVTINGGSFTGGSGNYGGAGLEVQAATANIYGGTFTGGAGTYGTPLRADVGRRHDQHLRKRL